MGNESSLEFINVKNKMETKTKEPVPKEQIKQTANKNLETKAKTTEVKETKAETNEVKETKAETNEVKETKAETNEVEESQGESKVITVTCKQLDLIFEENKPVNRKDEAILESSILKILGSGNEIIFPKSLLPNSLEKLIVALKKKNIYDDYFFYISSKNKNYKLYSEETYAIFKEEVSLNSEVTELKLHLQEKSKFIKQIKPASINLTSIEPQKESEEEKNAMDEIDIEIDSLLNKYTILNSNMIETKNNMIQNFQISLKNEILFTPEKNQEFMENVLYDEISKDLIVIPCPPSKLDDYFGNDQDKPNKCNKCKCDNKEMMLYCKKCNIYICYDCYMRFKGLEHSHVLSYKPRNPETTE